MSLVCVRTSHLLVGLNSQYIINVFRCRPPPCTRRCVVYNIIITAILATLIDYMNGKQSGGRGIAIIHNHCTQTICRALRTAAAYRAGSLDSCKKYVPKNRLTEHLEDGFTRLGNACWRHAGDSSGTHGRGTCRRRRRLGDRRLLLLVTARGDGGATESDADPNVENCNENHRQNEE